MIVKMIQNLENKVELQINSLETRIEKMQEKFNKDLGEILISNVFSFGIMAIRPSLVAQMVKHLPTMQETQVQSLGREDLREKAMAPHSSTLAWKIS